MIVSSTLPSQGYNELDIVILDHLAKLLGFSESKTDVSIISDFFASENNLEPMLRWQRESFLEWYAGTNGKDHMTSMMEEHRSDWPELHWAGTTFIRDRSTRASR